MIAAGEACRTTSRAFSKCRRLAAASQTASELVNIAVSLAEFSMFPIERQENVDRFGADHVQFPTLHAGLSPPATSSGEIFMAPAGMDRLRQACNSRDRRRLDKECVPFCSSLALQRGHRIAPLIEVPGTP